MLLNASSLLIFDILISAGGILQINRAPLCATLELNIVIRIVLHADVFKHILEPFAFMVCDAHPLKCMVRGKPNGVVKIQKLSDMDIF